MSHLLAFIVTRTVFFYLLSLDPNYEKPQMHQNDPKMALNVTRSRSRHICTTGTFESQISLRFALRPLVLQKINSFGFSIGYNDKYEIFEKILLKSEIQYVVLWGALDKFKP